MINWFPHEKLAHLKSLPNKLTLGRILIIPVLLIIYPLGHEYVFIRILAAGLFLLAAITDFFDGYLARKYNNESQIGALLDPIADKVLLTCCIVFLTSTGKLIAFLAGLILVREVCVTGIRMAALEQGFHISVSSYGKAKTVLQSIAIFCLMLDINNSKTIGMIAIWAALGLAYYSGYYYWQNFWHHSNQHFRDLDE